MTEALHSPQLREALERGGLLPPELAAQCLSVDLHVGVDEAVVVRYAVLLTGDQLHALGQALCASAVSDRLKG